jgi:P27 family predicted phage terminase small subunit
MTKKASSPTGLSPEAKRLWTSIATEYEVADSAGLRLLQTAVEALDLMRRAESVVHTDGMTVKDRYGAVRAHPLLATVRDARAAMLAALRALNLDIEPLRDRIGRPPGE